MPTDSSRPQATPMTPAETGAYAAWLGRVIDGRYRIEKLLGAGAAGVVYRAHDQQQGEAIAIKLLSEEIGATGQMRSRFDREGQLLTRMSHPNIVEFIGYGVEGEVPYLAMELLEGETLEDVLQDAEPMAWHEVLAITSQVLDALAFAHEHGVVHRDLKPGNVFLRREKSGRFHVKLLDFGLAKMLEADDPAMAQTLTRTGMVMGTPLYMAPEQATGDRIDVRVDVYAAGCVLFEMVTGRPPYVEPTHSELVKAHLVSPVPRLAAACAGLEVEPELQQLVDKAMAKSPGDRFQDAAHMRDALQRLPVEASRPPLREAGVEANEEARRGAVFKRVRAYGLLILSLAVGLPILALYFAREDPGVGEGPQKLEDVEVGAERIDAENPWQREGVPPELRALYEKVKAGEGITREEMLEIQAYARKHPRDARPYLLLARGFANRDWRKDAINRYVRAYRVDSSSRGDPQVLPDLLAMTADPRFGDRAVGAIAEIYGKEALPYVEEALQDAPEGSEQARRLRELRKKLTQG